MNISFRLTRTVEVSEDGVTKKRVVTENIDVPVRPAVAGLRRQVRKFQDNYRRALNNIRREFPEIARISEEEARKQREETQRRREEARRVGAASVLEDGREAAREAVREVDSDATLSINEVDMSPDLADESIAARSKVDDVNEVRVFSIAQVIADQSSIENADLAAGILSPLDSEFWADQIYEELEGPVDRFCTAYNL